MWARLAALPGACAPRPSAALGRLSSQRCKDTAVSSRGEGDGGEITSRPKFPKSTCRHKASKIQRPELTGSHFPGNGEELQLPLPPARCIHR